MSTLRLGVIGMSEGNGHPYSWSAIINGYDPCVMRECPFPAIPAYLAERSFPEEQLAGARVTHVWTQSRTVSEHVARASRIDHVVEEPGQMLAEIDALLLARDDAENHAAFAAPFLRAGLPVYLDKPPALTVRSLDALYEAAPHPAQIFSCSALRFAEELKLTPDETAAIGPLRSISGITPKSWDRYAAHVLDPVITNLQPGKVRESQLMVKNGAVTLIVDWCPGLHGEFTATGRSHGEIALTYTGERSAVTKEFRDSFSAFRSALALFIDAARERRPGVDYEHLRRLVQLIELGRRVGGCS